MTNGPFGTLGTQSDAFLERNGYVRQGHQYRRVRHVRHVRCTCGGHTDEPSPASAFVVTAAVYVPVNAAAQMVDVEAEGEEADSKPTAAAARHVVRCLKRSACKNLHELCARQCPQMKHNGWPIKHKPVLTRLQKHIVMPQRINNRHPLRNQVTIRRHLGLSESRGSLRKYFQCLERPQLHLAFPFGTLFKFCLLSSSRSTRDNYAQHPCVPVHVVVLKCGVRLDHSGCC